MRFLLEIVSGIKKLMPRFLLSVRLNIDDFVSGGLQMDESILISQALQAAGTDIIHCSSGTYASGLKSIVIGGGSTGCELAEYLALQNNQVTIIEQDTILARGMEKKNRRDLLNRLAALPVQRKTGKCFKEVDADRLSIQDQAGQEEEIIADRLVWATGARSHDLLYHEAMDHVRWLFLIGDASEVRGFAEAISEGEAVAGYICDND